LFILIFRADKNIFHADKKSRTGFVLLVFLIVYSLSFFTIYHLTFADSSEVLYEYLIKETSYFDLYSKNILIF